MGRSDTFKALPPAPGPPQNAISPRYRNLARFLAAVVSCLVVLVLALTWSTTLIVLAAWLLLRVAFLVSAFGLTKKQQAVLQCALVGPPLALYPLEYLIKYLLVPVDMVESNEQYPTLCTVVASCLRVLVAAGMQGFFSLGFLGLGIIAVEALCGPPHPFDRPVLQHHIPHILVTGTIATFLSLVPNASICLIFQLPPRWFTYLGAFVNVLSAIACYTFGAVFATHANSGERFMAQFLLVTGLVMALVSTQSQLQFINGQQLQDGGSTRINAVMFANVSVVSYLFSSLLLAWCIRRGVAVWKIAGPKLKVSKRS
ncbi:hypothetical protein MKEN_01149300 [Mycena kentingensis (nom. inval.)]|nr:hypothetical protein MKEN_01149300 [Mycena kentingensis (nom. inval.)]